MPSFNFKKQFAADVLSGKKHQTIRARRKHRPRPGQTAHLFTGLRTKSCRKLGQHTILWVEDITITETDVVINGDTLQSQQERDDFARADGFTNFLAMVAFFRENHGLPFTEGDLITW